MENSAAKSGRNLELESDSPVKAGSTIPEPAAVNIDSLIGSEEETKESVEDFVNQITERQPAEPALNSLNENIELLADLALKDRDRYSR